MDARALEKLIYRESGLLGVSGISSDMRTLRASSEAAAREAIALFVYRIVREVGSQTAALGGLDALLFTGGIGEHAAAIRAETLAGLRVLGPRLDAAANAAHGGATEGRITAPGSPLLALVIPTNEELVIARETARLAGIA